MLDVKFGIIVPARISQLALDVSNNSRSRYDSHDADYTDHGDAYRPEPNPETEEERRARKAREEIRLARQAEERRKIIATLEKKTGAVSGYDVLDAVFKAREEQSDADRAAHRQQWAQYEKSSVEYRNTPFFRKLGRKIKGRLSGHKATAPQIPGMPPQEGMFKLELLMKKFPRDQWRNVGYILRELETVGLVLSSQVAETKQTLYYPGSLAEQYKRKYNPTLLSGPLFKNLPGAR